MTPVDTVLVCWLAYALACVLSLKAAIVWQPEASTRVGAAAGAVVFFLFVSPALSVVLYLDQRGGRGARVADWMLSPKVA